MEKKFYIKEEDKIDDGFSYSSCLFPYFPSRADIVKPLGLVSLERFLKSHKEPKADILETFKLIEGATLRQDKKLKDSLKQTKLTYFTPSVQVSERRYENVESFTGVMVMEYDKLGEENAEKLKRKIFKRFKSCICAYLSPSKSGCKFLFKIPIVNSVEEYKEYFYGLASYLEQIEGFDSSSQSCVLPLFISYDLDMLIREENELETWILKGSYPTSIDNSECSDFVAEDVTEEDRRYVFNIVNKWFRKIDEEQEGHRNIISIGLLCGGYASAGYVSEQEIIEYLEEKISNSEYCAGRQDYFRTIRWAVTNGKDRSIKLDKNGKKENRGNN